MGEASAFWSPREREAPGSAPAPPGLPWTAFISLGLQGLAWPLIVDNDVVSGHTTHLWDERSSRVWGQSDRVAEAFLQK